MSKRSKYTSAKLVQNNKNSLLTMRILELSPDQIKIGDNQPRDTGWEDDPEIDKLASNISKVGLINPIVVRNADNEDTRSPEFREYVIVNGHRRFMACKKIGLTIITASIFTGNDRTAFVNAFYENTMRKEMSPTDIGRSYIKLLDEFEYNIKDILELEGKGESYIRQIQKYINIAKANKELSLHLNKYDLNIHDISDMEILSRLSALVRKDEIDQVYAAIEVYKQYLNGDLNLSISDVRSSINKKHLDNEIETTVYNKNKEAAKDIINGFIIERKTNSINIKYVGQKTGNSKRYHIKNVEDKILEIIREI